MIRDFSISPRTCKSNISTYGFNEVFSQSITDDFSVIMHTSEWTCRSLRAVVFHPLTLQCPSSRPHPTLSIADRPSEPVQDRSSRQTLGQQGHRLAQFLDGRRTVTSTNDFDALRPPNPCVDMCIAEQCPRQPYKVASRMSAPSRS